MSLTDLKEAKLLCEWAVSHEDHMIFDKQHDDHSYFRDHISEDTYMMQYGFSSIRGLNELIHRVTDGRMDDKAVKALSVAAFKYKPDDNAASEKSEERQFEIPEYIYNF